MNKRWPDNRICYLLGLEHPIIQAGMVYNSGARLAAAVANAGGLGLIAAGGLTPEQFRQEICTARSLTAKPFGVNIPLAFSAAADCLTVALQENIKIFFTSAGSPKRVVGRLKKEGCTVVHVVPSPELAIKCQDAGCDAIVCEGFEAGGHNGREEITTMVLVPECTAVVDIPVIAAGGIATGRQMAAALVLGAEGVQIGSRFAITTESASHDNYKQAVVRADAGDTRLMLKAHLPARLLKNAFSEKVLELETAGASRQDLVELLGTGRARKGMLEGDLENGELEIGQVSGLIDEVLPAAEIIKRLLSDFDDATRGMSW